jgi:hypothetical protein
MEINSFIHKLNRIEPLCSGLYHTQLVKRDRRRKDSIRIMYWWPVKIFFKLKELSSSAGSTVFDGWLGLSWVDSAANTYGRTDGRTDGRTSLHTYSPRLIDCWQQDKFPFVFHLVWRVTKSDKDLVNQSTTNSANYGQPLPRVRKWFTLQSSRNHSS